MPDRDYNAEREARRRAREREAGRTDLGPSSGYDSAYHPGRYDETRVSDFDAASADIPLWGLLSGAGARRDAARNASDRLAAMDELGRIDLPGIDELTTDYSLEGETDEYGNLLGDPSAFGTGDLAGMSAQRRALRELQGLSDAGGYTTADREQARAMRGMQGQAMRGANEAALQQLQARGMAGGGAELAARLGASESANFANAQADAGIQQTAMMRALQALQMQGAMGSSMNTADAQRKAALDQFNQANMGWRRGREERNTGWFNRQEDQRVGARQQQFSNQYGVQQDRANLRAGFSAGRTADGQRRDDADRAALGAVGTAIDELL